MNSTFVSKLRAAKLGVNLRICEKLIVNCIKCHSTTTTSSVGPVSSVTVAALSPPVIINNSRSIGTLQPKSNNSNDINLNVHIHHLVGQHVLDFINVKSLLEEKLEVRHFVSKVGLDPYQLLLHDGQQQHPFIRVAGHLFFQQQDFPSCLSTPGLLIYLMGKLFQERQSLHHPDSTITQKTLCLSRSINQSAAAFRIHRTIQETRSGIAWNKLAMNKINKLATLAGDLLVAESIRNLSSLRDNELLHWTMNSLADFSSFEFQPTQTSTLTPEGSLLASGFCGVAKMYGRQGSLEAMARLGQALGFLWTFWMDSGNNNYYGTHKRSLANIHLTVEEEALNVLDSEFACGQLSQFFKDFVLLVSHGTS